MEIRQIKNIVLVIFDSAVFSYIPCLAFLGTPLLFIQGDISTENNQVTELLRERMNNLSANADIYKIDCSGYFLNDEGRATSQITRSLHILEIHSMHNCSRLYALYARTVCL